ncbi:MAG: aspartate kinase [Clostridia bacterium]|nr:aspartate kinase [Clostridia bacterium]
MDNLVVMKFGGSSLADNQKIEQAVQKVKSFLEQKKRAVVIVSAQGNKTDELIKEAQELDKQLNTRELDMLLSTGEQISCAKFTMALQKLGYKAISLTGWQAGILTSSDYTKAKIQDIYPIRILEELKNNQVIVIAGFQGIDKKQNITTLGRDGSDTTAVAITAALGQKECYIFTDIDGVYNKDPHKYLEAKKIENLSYEEMEELVRKGAKVLHDRSIKIAKKYQIKIIVASTIEEKEGSIIS